MGAVWQLCGKWGSPPHFAEGFFCGISLLEMMNFHWLFANLSDEFFVEQKKIYDIFFPIFLRNEQPG